MTVMFLGRLVTRPLRAAVTRHAGAGYRRKHPGRRSYHDPFFADPAIVEDDSRRMRVRNAEREAAQRGFRPGS